LISLLTPAIAFGINLLGQVAVTAQPQQYQFYCRVVLAGIGAILVICGIIFAIIALSGMKEHGREGIFGKAIGGIVLNSLLIVTLLALIPALGKAKAKSEAAHKSVVDIQESVRQLNGEVQKNLKKGTNEEPTFEKMDQFEKSVNEASKNLTGNEALTMKASAAYIGKLNGLRRDYEAAMKDLKEAKILSAPSDSDKEGLDTKRAIVEKFLKANAGLRDFLAHGDQRFRDEFDALQVSPLVTEAALISYRQKADRVNPLVVRIRETDDRIGDGMLKIIGLEKDNWGSWSVSETSGKIMFKNSALLSQYNAFSKEIRDASVEQQKLQAQLLEVNKHLQ